MNKEIYLDDWNYDEMERPEMNMCAEQFVNLEILDSRTYSKMNNEEKFYYLYNKINDLCYLLYLNKDVIKCGG